MDIRNRVAVITGGASGLGLACAQRLCKEGAAVAAIDANAAALEQLAGNGIRGWRCDVSSASEMEQAFDAIRDQLGRTSILVNFAAIATPGAVVRKGQPMPL